MPIKIAIDDKEFKANLKGILSGVQVADFDKVANALQNFAVSAQTIGQTNFKDNGFRSFVNSIDKISKVTINPSLVRISQMVLVLLLMLRTCHLA